MPARGPKATPAPSTIVSSQHLAYDDWRFSEFEYGLIIAQNSFTRWMTRCMTAAGYRDFSALEVLVVHNVNHRNRDKRLVDICFMLNIEDQHTVIYALKKLTGSGLVKRQKRGKEIYYSTTPAGTQACEKYREIRARCLLSALKSIDHGEVEVGKAADLLRGISGIYDQAARASSSM